MKTLSEFKKDDKINLLKAVKSGEVNLKNLKATTTIVSDGKDWFYGLMVQSSTTDGQPGDVVFIGAAKREMEDFMNSIKENDTD